MLLLLLLLLLLLPLLLLLLPLLSLPPLQLPNVVVAAAADVLRCGNSRGMLARDSAAGSRDSGTHTVYCFQCQSIEVGRLSVVHGHPGAHPTALLVAAFVVR